MNNKEYITDLYEKKGKTYQEIGNLLGLSRQRIHQIHTNYRAPVKDARDHKVLTAQKLLANGFDTHGETPYGNGIKGGGQDYVREWVRIRDRHTCQVCRKEWQKGKRRLDVHHLDEE